MSKTYVGSVQQKQSCPKFRLKPMLIILLDTRGIVHFKYVPEGQTVARPLYVRVLEHLLAHFIDVRPQLAENHKALAHSSFIVKLFLAENGIPTTPHSSYSPEIAPVIFSHFPQQVTPQVNSSQWRKEGQRSCYPESR